MPATVSNARGAPIETTKAPAPVRTERRERVTSWLILIIPSAHHSGGAFDRLQDAHMRAAAAFQRLQRVFDLSIRRLLLVVQERGGGHDPAVHAVAALRHLFLDIDDL